MARRIIVCQHGSSNKFWIGEIDPSNQHVVNYWFGRLGATKGTAKSKEFVMPYQANQYLDGMIYEKERDGYRQVDESEFRRLTAQSAAAGLTNKIGMAQWVEWDRLTAGEIPPAVHPSRLADPSYEPALMLAMTTKKEYGGRKFFRLIFTANAVYERVTYSAPGDYRRDYAALRKIEEGDPVYPLVEKIGTCLTSFLA